MNSSNLPVFDPVHDVLRYERNPLDAIFSPKNVALIGATETLGQRWPHHHVESDQQPLWRGCFPDQPKTPERSGCQGIPGFSFAVPEPVDLAVIVTPAPSMPGLIGECVEAGVKGAIIISAGSKRPARRVWSWNARS